MIHPILENMSETARGILTGRGPVEVADMPLSGHCLLTLACAVASRKTTVLVADGPRRLEQAHQGVTSMANAFAPDNERLAPLYYPPWEDFSHDDSHGASYRLEALEELAQESNLSNGDDTEKARQKRHLVVVTSIQALMQKVTPADDLRKSTFQVVKGCEIEPGELPRWLEEKGYTFCDRVQEQGETATRGSITDLWPLTEELPLRIDFEGETVDSIRQFDPLDQRTVKKLESVMLSPCDDAPPAADAGNAVSFLDYLPAETTVIWSTRESVNEHGEIYAENAREAGRADSVLEPGALNDKAADNEFFQIMISELSGESVMPRFLPVQDVFRIPGRALHPDAMESSRQKLMSQLHEKASSGSSVAVFLDTEGSLHHFREALGETRPANMDLVLGTVPEGTVCEELGIVLVSESDIYGKKEAIGQRYMPGTRAAPSRKGRTAKIADISEIEPGDLVVHSSHGIGRFLGLNEIQIQDRTQEVLTVEYAEGAKLHVPVNQSHLLTRYIGISGQKVKLHKLGGRRWSKEKAQAQEDIVDFASELLETQATRNALQGHAFPEDTAWQHDFDNSFPFKETEDQRRVISEVKNDMQAQRPMDRLICGDAGYGKTEVAMRAAFKAASDSRQTAVLVPTTVLAQQHYNTFSERMAAFPLRIEMLSRFLNKSEQAEVLEALREGQIDIVIGTHALLQSGVEFKKLGLVIIDEEQRFGVAHKEKFKHVRQLVDVLTMTATPIPRTLYMSMTGVRDMSLIQTAPRERMPIETIITRSRDEVIREAVLRELNRDGQVFFLHNRVNTIASVEKRLKRLLPEAAINTAHGQMPSSQLESVVKSFVMGQFNVLLCTTIIESGMDIPRANTIIIDRADKFGIADLYQLRGRVGRSTHKAYAYLLMPENETLDPAARKRLNAIERHGGLGGSFHLAIQDLEIRGAGNILGSRQSGYIRTVGFGLYCQLMKRTIAMLRKEPAPPVIDVDVRLDFLDLAPSARSTENAAYIPFEYVGDEKIRLEIYRKIAEISTPSDADSVYCEIEDRFGRLPVPVARLLKTAEIKLAAHAKKIDSVEVKANKLMLVRNGDYLKEGPRFPRLYQTSPDCMLEEIVDKIGQMDNSE